MIRTLNETGKRCPFRIIITNKINNSKSVHCVHSKNETRGMEIGGKCFYTHCPLQSREKRWDKPKVIRTWPMY
jgi:hypothetical protein